MKAYGTKIGVVLFALTIGLTPFVTRIGSEEGVLGAIDLGIDLAGGTNMVFEVDREATEAEGKAITPDIMDKMVAAVSRRVNPTGTEEVTVRRMGADRIEVIVPGADDEKREQTKRRVTDLGELEFALLANEVDHVQEIQEADSLGRDVNEIFRGDNLVAMWRRPAVDDEGNPKIQSGDRVHTRQKDGQTEFLCVVDPDRTRRITGRYLKSVRETVTDRGLAIGFTFNERGGVSLPAIDVQTSAASRGGIQSPALRFAQQRDSLRPHDQRRDQQFRGDRRAVHTGADR